MQGIRRFGKVLAHHLTMAMILSLGVLAAATGMVGTIDGEFVFSKSCSADWCKDGRDNAFMRAEWHQMVDEQLASLGCDKRKRLTATVAVVNQQYSQAEQSFGKARHDLAVVRVVSFDEAWRAGKAHEVNVVGWCGR